MPTDDEQLADVVDALERMVAAGELELSTRRDPMPLARALLDAMESRPDLDLEKWLLAQDAVVELFVDSDDLATRLAQARTRGQASDPEPSWNDELAARIAETPDDVDARLVFADWLEQRGDPRGELIQIQARPRDHELARREQLFMDRWRHYLFGPLADDPRAEATFRLGFVDQLVCPIATFAAARSHPSLRFVRDLRLTGDPRSLLPLPPTLDTLAVDTRIGSPLVLSELVAGLGRLRELDVRCDELLLDLDVAPLSNLRVLWLLVDRLTVTGTWARGLPALERLALPGQPDVTELLSSPPPALTTLRLTSARTLGRLLGTPLLRQLSVLDMSDARSLEGVGSLLRDRGAQLAHLSLLDFRGSTPTAELQALRSLGPYVKGPRQRR